MNPSQQYSICYYGLLAERRGLAEETLNHPATSPAALYAALDAEHRLGLLVADLRVAVNDAFAPWDHPLADGDRIALLPPMSGG
jgi:molybdopterin synthase sulfur carrier subunit